MSALTIRVTITNVDGSLFRQYTMNHDDQAQRRVLGEQCRNAFEAGQSVATSPVRDAR